MSEAQLATIDKKFVSVLDANVNTKKKRDALQQIDLIAKSIVW